MIYSLQLFFWFLLHTLKIHWLGFEMKDSRGILKQLFKVHCKSSVFFLLYYLPFWIGGYHTLSFDMWVLTFSSQEGGAYLLWSGFSSCHFLLNSFLWSPESCFSVCLLGEDQWVFSLALSPSLLPIVSACLFLQKRICPKCQATEKPDFQSFQNVC